MDRILGKFMPIPHAEGCSSWYSNRTQKGQFFSEIPSRSLLQSEIPLELIGQYYDNGSLSPVDHHYSLVLIPESGLSKGVRRSPQWGHAQSSWGHSTSTALELQSTSTRLNNGHKLSSPKKKTWFTQSMSPWVSRTCRTWQTLPHLRCHVFVPSFPGTRQPTWMGPISHQELVVSAWYRPLPMLLHTPNPMAYHHLP